MNLNQEISFNIHSKNSQSIIKALLIIISFISLVVSSLLALVAVKKINLPPPEAKGGQSLNQQQVEKAFTLLQDKTIRFYP